MAQGKEFQKQIIRFGNTGMQTNVPPELLPYSPERSSFTLLENVISVQDGTLQSTLGGSQIFAAVSANNIRRLTDWTTSTLTPQSILIYGAGANLFYAPAPSYPPGASVQIATGFDGRVISMVADAGTKLAKAKAWMFIGDLNSIAGSDPGHPGMIKVDVAGNVEKFGISPPLAAATFAAGAGTALNGSYDWRYTYFNQHTGHEGNPSDVAPQITLVNQGADIGVIASLDTQVTEIFIYRRGGTLNDDWRRLPGPNPDGSWPNVTNAAINDNNADTDLAAALTLSTDNDVPVVSVDANGTTLHEIPIPYLWTVEEVDTMFGCGDPNRPGTVYWSKAGDHESWPVANSADIAHPEDRALNGLTYDGRSFVFSKRNLYQMVPNLVGATQSWSPIKTPCAKGLVAPWAFCVGPKIWFVSTDGIYETDGGEPIKISDDLRSLFPYQSTAGFQTFFNDGVNFGGVNSEAQLANIRLAYHNGEVRFYYQDINDIPQVAVYNTQQKTWRVETSNAAIWGYSDEISQTVLVQGMVNGDIIANTGNIADRQLNGQDIACQIITGFHDQGFPRIDKHYGDMAIWLDPGGATIDWRMCGDSDLNTNISTGQLTGSGLQRFVLNTRPNTLARNAAIAFSWSAHQTAQPVFYWIEIAYIPLVDDIVRRPTDWDDAGHPMDKLVKGVIIEADTKGNVISFDVEYDGGQVMASFSIGPNTNKFPFIWERSWTGVRAREVRLVPTTCLEFKEYRIASWIVEQEPTSITHYESAAGAMGFYGYHFDREAYVELMSNDIVTVTPQIDGVNKPAYTLASTAGVRSIVNLPFAPNKGKIYKYSLDCPSAFQLHDFKIRSRGWNTRIFFDLYYRVNRPDFGTPLTGGGH